MIVPSAKHAEASLATALDENRKRYRKRLKACRETATEENVHQLRTTLRRLLSLLRLFSHFDEVPKLKKITRELKDQLDSLGPLRDIQFQKKFLEEHPDLKDTLSDYYEHLDGTEISAVNDVAKRLDEVSLGDVDRRLRKIEDALPRLFEKEEAAVLPLLLQESFDLVSERDREVDRADPNSVHQVRIALKKFRYLAEALQPLLKIKPDTLKTLKSTQDLLGNIQDLAVMLDDLEKYYGKRKRRAKRVDILRRELNQEEEASTRRFLKVRNQTYDVIQKELRIHQ